MKPGKYLVERSSSSLQTSLLLEINDDNEPRQTIKTMGNNYEKQLLREWLREKSDNKTNNHF